MVRHLPVEEESNTVEGAVADVIFQQDRFKVTLENGLYVYLQKPARVGGKIQVPVKVECLA
jgi:translation initiation factor IF-1